MNEYILYCFIDEEKFYSAHDESYSKKADAINAGKRLSNDYPYVRLIKRTYDKYGDVEWDSDICEWERSRTWGGARAGAGRKAATPDTIPVHWRVSERAKEWMKGQAMTQGVSIATILDELIAAFEERV